MTRQNKRLSLVFMLVFVAFFFTYFLTTSGYQSLAEAQWLTYLSDASDSRLLFVLMIALLPLVGFPISIFCILSGLKFGLVGGLSVIGLAMFWHLLFAYWLSRSFLKTWLKKRFAKYSERMDKQATQETFAYSVAFVAVPVIPYCVKNYLMALNNLPFWHYMGVCWSIQMLYSFPVVGLASATQNTNYIVALFALLGLVLVYFLSRWAKQVSVKSVD